ncbi:MAG TPA: small multi-drug export protein [Sphingobacteriaceae bacterium]|nr:small multi-drug export protein [Sphingobacteriaceae bacterium]
MMGWIENLPAPLVVVLTAMLPVVELRGAIPLGVALGLPPLAAMVFAMAGTMLPVPFILLGFEPVSRVLRRRLGLQRFIEWVYDRTQARAGTARRYGWFGLVFLVALPVPGTGAWTGALLASFLGYSFRSAMLAIATGTFLAGSLVTLLLLLGIIVTGS